MFHVTVRGTVNESMEWYVQLVKNDEPVMNLTAWKPYAPQHITGSNMCIVSCNTGDLVWNKLSYPLNETVTVYGNHYTTFGGFMLSPSVS